MRASGKKIAKMDSEFIFMLMETDMKEVGLMTKDKVMER
jgi:hypothetical protein